MTVLYKKRKDEYYCMKTENKTKKGKNKAFKAITGLLALAVLTTTVIGATMAYYTVTKTVSGEAGVARSDIKIKVNDSVFSSVYSQDSGAITGLSAVIGNTDTDVVAPGTTKSFEYSYEGVSEVLMQGTFDSVFELNDKWKDADGNFYCPLIISIHTKPATGGPDKEQDITVNGLNYQSAEEFKQAVLGQIKFADYIPSNVVWLLQRMIDKVLQFHVHSFYQ